MRLLLSLFLSALALQENNRRTSKDNSKNITNLGTNSTLIAGKNKYDIDDDRLEEEIDRELADTDDLLNEDLHSHTKFVKGNDAGSRRRIHRSNLVSGDLSIKGMQGALHGTMQGSTVMQGQRLGPTDTTGGASSQGFMGYPMSTWALVGLVVAVLAIMCLIGIFFFRKYMRQVLRFLEDAICNCLWVLFIVPIQIICTVCRTISYPIKECIMNCSIGVQNYYKPYKITS
ncbi:hypothetical protein AAMO2058_000374700 [Amorphochlora amoebiformis]